MRARLDHLHEQLVAEWLQARPIEGLALLVVTDAEPHVVDHGESLLG
jgi:hypothetical protein